MIGFGASEMAFKSMRKMKLEKESSLADRSEHRHTCHIQKHKRGKAGLRGPE
jgi:hypothetical protein